MTCFNASKYIELSIKSIINQKYKNWELIIVDDFSHDNSVEIIKKLIPEKLDFINLKNILDEQNHLILV